MFFEPRVAIRQPIIIDEALVGGLISSQFPRWAALRVDDLVTLASDLAEFLKALQDVDVAGPPEPNAHNFFRGAHLSVYDSETMRCIGRLRDEIDSEAAAKVWRRAILRVT